MLKAIIAISYIQGRDGGLRKESKQINSNAFYSSRSFAFSSNQFTMKLRNRQGHVSNNIKQEDHKSDLTLINTPSSTVNETKAFSLGIKQEDTKNYKSLLKQDGKSAGLSTVNIL